MPCFLTLRKSRIATIHRVIFFGGVLLHSACIPAPLPSAGRNIARATTPQSQNLPRRAPVSELNILLAGRSSSHANLLGSQYLFGIIPLTAIRGIQTQIVGEAIREELADQGARVTLAAPDSPERPNEDFEATIQFLVRDLSVNAYDLFFVRRLSVSGDLELQVNFKAARGNASMAGSERITFSEGKTAKFGFLPALSMMLHTAIRERARPFLSETLVTCLRKGATRAPGEKGPRFINPVQLQG